MLVLSVALVIAIVPRFVLLLLLRSVAMVSVLLLVVVVAVVVRLVDEDDVGVLVLSLLVLFVLSVWPLDRRGLRPIPNTPSSPTFFPALLSLSSSVMCCWTIDFVAVPSGDVTGDGADVVIICTALPGRPRKVPRVPVGLFVSLAQQNTLFSVVGTVPATGRGGMGKSVSSIASQDDPSLFRWFCCSRYRSGSLMGEMGEMLIASAALPGVRMYLLLLIQDIHRAQTCVIGRVTMF